MNETFLLSTWPIWVVLLLIIIALFVLRVHIDVSTDETYIWYDWRGERKVYKL